MSRYNLKKSLLLMLVCLLHTISYSQQENTEYLNDITDLVGTSGKGFQMQLGSTMTWSNSNEEKNNPYYLPFVVTKFAFNNHLGIQGTIGISEDQTMINGKQSINQTDVSNLTLCAEYEFDPDLKLGIFNQFSFNWTNTIQPYVEDSFYSELDLNSSTQLSSRTEIDYTFGFGCQTYANASGVYTLGIDYYITPKMLFELSNNGQWTWAQFKNSFIHAAEFKILFLSKLNRQFNLGFVKGINYNFNYIGFTFIQNL